jgi:hypothetical protein
MAIDWRLSWLVSLESLTQAEKEATRGRNLATLWGI